jgi:hypothetical protein
MLHAMEITRVNFTGNNVGISDHEWIRASSRWRDISIASFRDVWHVEILLESNKMVSKWERFSTKMGLEPSSAERKCGAAPNVPFPGSLTLPTLPAKLM